MKMGERIVSLIIAIAIWLTMPGLLNAPGSMRKIEAADLNKVIRVGGSTTFQEYPNYLQNVLGSDYQVINRGQNSTTATYIQSLDKNNVNAPEPNGIFDGYSYRVTSTFQAALADNPDCVVLMIGGNDAKTNNWEKIQDATGKTPEEKFEEDYRWLINQFKNLPSHPDVVIATTGWAQNDGLFTIVNKYVDIAVPIQKKVARDMGLEVVDINAKTKGRNDIYTDGIHYNTTGYQLLADSIAPTVRKLKNASQCDLRVTDIQTDRTSQPGEEVGFLVTIENVGTAASRSDVKHGVPVYVDGECVNWCDTFMGPLQPGEKVTLEMNGGPDNKATWTAARGTHTVSAMVDDSGFIREINEDNNEKSVTMTFESSSEEIDEEQPKLLERFDSPAQGENWYDEMFPLGNGNIGASVYGGVENDSILINEKTLWSGGSQEYSQSIGEFNYIGGLAAPGEALTTYATRAQNAWKQARQDLQEAVNTHSATGNENYNIPQSVTDTINQMKGDKSNFGSYQELGDIQMIEPDYVEPSITRVYADKEHKNGTTGSESSMSLFDGNISTKYFADAASGTYTAPYTIEWDYSNAKEIESYTFTTGNDVEGRDPVAWTLYGSTSSSGENYVQIDQRTDTSDKGRNVSTDYTVTTKGKYVRYRLVVTQTRDGSPLQLSEIAVNASSSRMLYSNYERTLDLNNALANVSYKSGGKTYNREYFVSNPDNVMAVNLDAGGSSFSKFFRITTEQKTKEINAEIVADGSGVLTITGQPTPDSGFLNKTGYDKALYFAMKVKIIPEGGSISKLDDGILVSNASAITVIMSAGTNYQLSKSASYTDFFTGINPMDTVSANVDKAASKGYLALKEAHISDYKNLFDRVKLQLNDAAVPDKTMDELMSGYENGNTDAENRYLETLYYQFGRYLLIASSRENSLLPANLQGIWADGISPPWSADYHTNINLQMNYWLSESTNLSETHIPALEYVDSLVEKGKQGVETVFGTNEKGDKIRGWTIWHENNPWGNIAPAVSDAFYAPEDGAWMCKDIWDHYEFTMDKEYLAENYETLKQAALFWVDTLWEDTRDHTLVVNPSYSPEHGPYSLGATEAQSVVWGIFDEVIQASQILGISDSEVDEIRTAKSRLSGLKIGSAGQLQEWKDDTQLDITGDNGHRHVNHLYGLHPGDQIVPGRSAEDDKYAQAAKVTLNTRGDGGTGWSKAWKINFWARLLDGEHAQKMVKEILTQSTITNLLDEHPPFQIDGNFGATSGMTEMLLQSQGGIIKLLPAVSTKWSSGQVTGLKARGNVEVGMKWSDNTLTGAVLKPMADGMITVSAAGIANMPITKSGNAVSVQVVDDNTIKIDASKGDVYVVGETFGDVESEPSLNVSSDLGIKGYQISTTLGGFRVIGTTNDTVDGKNVKTRGLVYALSEVNGVDNNISNNDMYVGNESPYVKSYESTDMGTLDDHSFVMTMLFASYNQTEFNSKYKVRAYAVLENGDYVYSNVYSYSVYKISDYLYQKGAMTNKAAHDYLFNKILTMVDSSYQQIDFNYLKSVYSK